MSIVFIKNRMTTAAVSLALHTLGMSLAISLKMPVSEAQNSTSKSASSTLSNASSNTLSSTSSSTSSNTLSSAPKGEMDERVEAENQLPRRAEVLGAGEGVKERGMAPAYAMGVGAALSVGLALAFEVAARGKADRAVELVRSFGDTQGPCEGASLQHPLYNDYERARERARAWGWMSAGSMMVGAALGAGALAYWLWPSNTTQPAEAPKRQAMMVPMVGVSFFGSAIGGTF